MIDPTIASALASINLSLADAAKHIAILNQEEGDLAAKVAALQVSLDWTCWFVRALVGGMIAIFLTNVWQLFIMNKKDKK